MSDPIELLLTVLLAEAIGLGAMLAFYLGILIAREVERERRGR